MPGPVRNNGEAFAQLEAVMLRQMLQSSGAFRASSTPGAQLRTDMFIETLADAVAKAGGLGIAKLLERELGKGGAEEGEAAHMKGLPAGSFSRGFSGAGTPSVSLLSSRHNAAAATVGAVDDLDDPNSEAPLPEDPNADSIDDYQNGAPPRAVGQPPAGALSAGEVTETVTSGFGRRVHPVTGDLRFHTGVDLRAAEGAPIRAAAGGIVRDAGARGGYGKAVEIDHGDGTSTLYAHASELLVKKGQRVDEGQPLALVGHTGVATGPHLHFELRRHDHPVDPASGNLPIPAGRALNRYRERVEILVAGTPPGAGSGEKP
jgi:murein DD-endopeptidase MepM/ murein hydrolase activator NlpD